MVLSSQFGDVAQLGERDNRTVEVRGSIPLVSTITVQCNGYPWCTHSYAESALQIANTYGIVEGQLRHER